MSEPAHFCEYCHGLARHEPGCPEYETEPVSTCDLCGAEIYCGERVIRYADITAHSDCFLEKYESEVKANA